MQFFHLHSVLSQGAPYHNKLLYCVIKLNQSTLVNEHQKHRFFNVDICAVNLSSLTHPVNSWVVGLRPVSCEGVWCPPRYRISPNSIRYSVLPLNCVSLCQNNTIYY